MEHGLRGVPETLLIPLWARAMETKRSQPIIYDEKAIEMSEKIDYDFSKFDGSWLTQVGVAVRTEILDREVKNFICKYPEALIINIGCGLDTRYLRVDNGRILWYDLDLPEAISIRKVFFQENERYKMIAKSVFDDFWMEAILEKAEKRPVLLVAEGVLMYFEENEMIELMGRLVTRFPKAHMLFEMFPRLLVKASGKHETLKKTDARVKWGLKNGQDIEFLHPGICFVEEWNLFDSHRERWRWMGVLASIPAVKNNFNDRIVHIFFR